jgi:hypothetical protein
MSLTMVQDYQTSPEFCYPLGYSPESAVGNSDWAYSLPALPASPYTESPLSSEGITHDLSWNPFDQSFASVQTSIDNGNFISSANCQPNTYQTGYGSRNTEGGAQPFVSLAAINETSTFDDLAVYENSREAYEASPLSSPTTDYQCREPKWSSSRRNSISSSSSKPAHPTKRRQSSDKNPRSSRTHSRFKSDFTPHLRSTTQPSRQTAFSSGSAKSPPFSENVRERTSHNQVEKQYRNRLNGQFETLLSSLPNNDDRNGAKSRVSKAEVLMLAKRHIVQLEREKMMLEGQRVELESDLEELKRRFVEMGGVCMP